MPISKPFEVGDWVETSGKAGYGKKSGEVIHIYNDGSLKVNIQCRDGSTYPSSKINPNHCIHTQPPRPNYATQDAQMRLEDPALRRTDEYLSRVFGPEKSSEEPVDVSDAEVTFRIKEERDKEKNKLRGSDPEHKFQVGDWVVLARGTKEYRNPDYGIGSSYFGKQYKVTSVDNMHVGIRGQTRGFQCFPDMLDPIPWPPKPGDRVRVRDDATATTNKKTNLGRLNRCASRVCPVKGFEGEVPYMDDPANSDPFVLLEDLIPVLDSEET